MLPIIEVEGSASRQGEQHGRLLAERVRDNLGIYFERFENEGGLRPAEVLERVARYWAVIETEHPDYAAGVAGIAAGAGEALLPVAALNLRYEILYHQFTQSALTAAENPLADGCTAFALMPGRTAEGHLVIGQNWDWIPEVRGALVRQSGDGGPERIGFTEAGIFGSKIGMNAAGIGLALNGLTSTADDWSSLRTPFHVRAWRILRAERFEEAVGIVEDEPRACSTHYLIAQAPDQVAGLEAAPEACRRLGPDADKGVYSHANHFEDTASMGIQEPPSDYRPHSVHRATRCGQIMREGDGRLSIQDITARLRDHDGRPNSVCRHPDPARGERTYQTVTSVIMDLDAGEMWATDGPPCEGDYQRVELD